MKNLKKENKEKPTQYNLNCLYSWGALYHEPLARVIAQALPLFDIKFAFTICIYIL